MTVLTNMRKDRAIDVRVGPTGRQSLVRLAPGEMKRVEGFDPKRKFNAALIESGELRVGGNTKKADDDDRNAQLKADLDAAETTFKQAKDEAEKAQKDVKDDPSDVNKKAFATAKEKLKLAGEAVGKAKTAFEKG